MLLTTSWNLPCKSVIVLDKETEKKVAANLNNGKKKFAVQKKEYVSSSKTAAEKNGAKSAKFAAQEQSSLSAHRTNEDSLLKSKNMKKVGKKVNIKTPPATTAAGSPSRQSLATKNNGNSGAAPMTEYAATSPTKSKTATTKVRKLSLGRTFIAQAAPVLSNSLVSSGSIAAAAETQDGKLNAKIFSVKPAANSNAKSSRPESPMTLLPLEKRPIDTEAKREVKFVKKSFNLVKKQKA